MQTFKNLQHAKTEVLRFLSKTILYPVGRSSKIFSSGVTNIWRTLTSNCGQAIGILTPLVLDHHLKSFSWSALLTV